MCIRDSIYVVTDLDHEAKIDCPRCAATIKINRWPSENVQGEYHSQITTKKPKMKTTTIKNNVCIGSTNRAFEARGYYAGA